MDCIFYNGHFCLAVLDPFDRSVIKKLPTEVRNDQMLCGRDGDWFKPKTTIKQISPDTNDVDVVFAAGACAAYDDCGHDIPPWYYTEIEQKAWKQGLEQGYKDIDALIQSEKKNVQRL